MSLLIYAMILGAIVLERLAELTIARRNTRLSLAQGGFEVAPEHYPWIVMIHGGLLVGSLAEAYFMQRPFNLTLFLSMLTLSLLCQGLRWWVIATLKQQWNTRIMIVPRLTLVTKGPFRWLKHPNYLAVILEGIAIPMMYNSWITALVFTVANLYLLSVRIRHENAALLSLSQKNVQYQPPG